MGDERWLSESQLLRYAHAGEAFSNTRNCPRVVAANRGHSARRRPPAASASLRRAARRLPGLALLRRPRLTWRRSGRRRSSARASPSQACRRSSPSSRHWRAPSRAASADNCQRFSPLSARHRRAAVAPRRPRPRLERLAVAVEPFCRPARRGVRFRLFVHYEAIWGAGVADPSSLPSCLRGLHHAVALRGSCKAAVSTSSSSAIRRRRAHGDAAPRTDVHDGSALARTDEVVSSRSGAASWRSRSPA